MLTYLSECLEEILPTLLRAHAAADRRPPPRIASTTVSLSRHGRI